MSASASDVGAAADANTGYGPRERLLILGTATLVTTLYAMTVTIANVALPRIRALSAATDEIAPIITLNIVATAVAAGLGLAGGAFSRRWLLLVAIACFTVTTLLCGLAANLETLILFTFYRRVRGPWRRSVNPFC